MNSNAKLSPHKPRHLALFVSFSGTGGVERVTLNLLQGLSAQENLKVDLLLVVARRGTPPEVPWPNIRVIDLGVRHSQMAIPALVRYLRLERPDVLMVAKDRAIRASIVAHALAGVRTRLFGQLHMNMQGFLQKKSWLSRWVRLAPMRWLFPRLSGIACVSEGVVKDTLEITGMDPERVKALKNPVIRPEMYDLAEEAIDFPWFNGDYQVVLAVGRLSPEKDYPTLLHSFVRFTNSQKVRLVILGEGPMRSELEELAVELGISAKVAFLGHQSNPYSYMKQSEVLVLSSRWEGAPTVLIEAMSLGTPCVATDCPYGPREILQDGVFGSLVPVGDHEALGAAIDERLVRPISVERLVRAVDGFRIESSAKAYTDFLFPSR